jgi:hypothetical protein
VEDAFAELTRLVPALEGMTLEGIGAEGASARTEVAASSGAGG